jgi:KipI family sensor histidine kinase inhibitor
MIRTLPLGDSAWWIGPEEMPGQNPIAALARTLAQAEILRADPPPGTLDVVTAFDSLAVFFDPDAAEAEIVREAILQRLAAAPHPPTTLPTGRLVEIPVHYGGSDGPDLEAVASQAGVTVDDLIHLHSSAEYRVAAVGFTPGFPYLLGLPEALHRAPRRATPRLLVPAGSVAVADGQAGIYPCASPAGWQILGRTHTRLFDPRSPRPALLRPGDRVRFVPVEVLQNAPQAAWFPPSTPVSAGIEILDGGSSSTVQDAGRQGLGAAGLAPGGATDRHAREVANLLVGNPPGCAGLEITLQGPTLLFHEACTVALAGAAATDMPHGIALPLTAGTILKTGYLRGSPRAFLAFSGGLQVTPMLGAAATDPRAGFGGHEGRSLRTGDRLALGKTPETAPIVLPGPTRLANPPTASFPQGPITIRVLPGLHADRFPLRILTAFHNETFRISPASDRMALRLVDPLPAPAQGPPLRSLPLADGVIQVPPDGKPIVLLPGRPTLGGYPQIACVISADLPLLARCLPGTPLRFVPVSPATARQARLDRQRDLAWLRTSRVLAGA